MRKGDGGGHSVAMILKVVPLLPLLWLLSGTNLVRPVDAASCSLPSFGDIVTKINEEQTSVEGTSPVVTELYYNCLQWDNTLVKVERFIVSAELIRGSQGSSQRWIFVCSSGSSYLSRITVAAAAVLTNSSTSSFDFGKCDASASNPSTGRSNCKKCSIYCLTRVENMSPLWA